ncbi:unnamed protein product [Caretta caretta]
MVGHFFMRFDGGWKISTCQNQTFSRGQEILPSRLPDTVPEGSANRFHPLPGVRQPWKATDLATEIHAAQLTPPQLCFSGAKWRDQKM